MSTKKPQFSAVLASGLSREVFPLGEVRRTELKSPSKEAKALPFYWNLPADHLENIKWRLYVKERCMEDEQFRANIVYMCQQDVCFFTETLGVIFEPRPNPRAMPLKLWEDQVDLLAWSDECYGRRDMGVEKSRGIGASWLYAIFLYHKWQFVPDTKIAISTKDETSLDGPDSNTLLGKLVYLHENMPAWMRLDHMGNDIMHRDKTVHILHNKRNHATAQGFVSTNDKLRSLRFTCVLYDEFAFYTRDVQAQLNSSVHTCPNRIFVSTWNGADNAFHRIMRKEQSTMLRCEMYWWNNSERWKGCYTSDNGKLRVLDKDYQYPADYPFVLDGIKRSPWVDFELSRPGSSVQSAMEELYGLLAQDDRKMWQKKTRDIIAAQVQMYSRECELSRHGDMQNRFEGRIKVWGDPLELDGPFVAGCDIAFGQGATYSTLEVLDSSTGRQVLEFACNDMVPVEFTAYVVGILQWLNDGKGDGHTYLDFENNGDQGTTFAKEIMRIGYGNVARRNYVKTNANKNDGTYLGSRNRDRGHSNLSELERAVLAGECRIMSEPLRQELDAFVKDEHGRPHFPSGEDGHGDRAQGMGIAWAACRERRVAPQKTPEQDARSEIMGYVNQDEPKKSWSEQWSTGMGRDYGV